MNSTVNTM